MDRYVPRVICGLKWASDGTRKSEIFLGEWMKARENRDQLVIATKYTIGYKNPDPKVKLKVCPVSCGSCSEAADRIAGQLPGEPPKEPDAVGES